MSEAGLPVQVRLFINRHITSVEQLELLILLASHPDKNWTLRQLIHEIRSSEASIRERLRQLMDGFLADNDETFRFAPSSPELASAIPELIRAYRQYRVRVIELIYSRHPRPKSKK